MSSCLRQLRRHASPRSDFPAQATACPPRIISNLILGTAAVMLLLLLTAWALTYLLAAA